MRRRPVARASSASIAAPRDARHEAACGFCSHNDLHVNHHRGRRPQPASAMAVVARCCISYTSAAFSSAVKA
jgi:hypothetical protein